MSAMPPIKNGGSRRITIWANCRRLWAEICAAGNAIDALIAPDKICADQTCVPRELLKMPVEIERKFLVKHDGWKSHCVRSVRICDGLLASSNGCKVRVRISERKATLAVKSAQVGVTRSEFEYEVPLADAEEMLRLCGDRHLEKI